jgi:sporulation protein YunB
VHILRYCCTEVKKRKCSPKKISISLSLILVGLLILFIVADGVVRSIIRGYPMSVASGVMLEKMDEAMEKVLSEKKLNPSAIDKVRYGDDGTVLSVETNTSDLNFVKTCFSKELGKILKEYGNIITVSVPIGTLIGNEYTIGRGPDVTFKLKYSYSVKTELNSTYYEAGINNTLHSIELNVTNTVFIVMPWGNNAKNVRTKYILAETVIIGKVPDAYTGVYDGSGEIVDDIFDHQAADVE